MSNNQHTFLALAAYLCLILTAFCIAAGSAKLLNMLTQ